MAWKQRVSIVALVVLAAVPMSGALCAMACSPAAEPATAHHGSRAAQQCDEPAPSPTGIDLEGVSDHDCGAHDAAFQQSATAAAGRIGVQIPPSSSTLSSGEPSFKSVSGSGTVVEYSSPPGSAPPTIPLILRV